MEIVCDMVETFFSNLSEIFFFYWWKQYLKSSLGKEGITGMVSQGGARKNKSPFSYYPITCTLEILVHACNFFFMSSKRIRNNKYVSLYYTIKFHQKQLLQYISKTYLMSLDFKFTHIFIFWYLPFFTKG